jgi:hypothetical protein
MTAPNFARLNGDRPEITRLMIAMRQAREALSGRPWSHPLEYVGEEWWADVLADPRARTPKRRSDYTAKQAFFRLADELREVILVACSKCEWKAAFHRAELIAAHGVACPMPSLLEHLAAPGCAKRVLVGAKAGRAHWSAAMKVHCIWSSIFERFALTLSAFLISSELTDLRSAPGGNGP